jgi:hypothetical protein
MQREVHVHSRPADPIKVLRVKVLQGIVIGNKIVGMARMPVRARSCILGSRLTHFGRLGLRSRPGFSGLESAQAQNIWRQLGYNLGFFYIQYLATACD